MPRAGARASARRRTAIKAARRSAPRRNERFGTALVLPRREAGVIVDPLEAQRIGTVWRCVAYLSGLIGQLPWSVYRPRPGGGAEADPESPVGWLIGRRPNPESSAYKFRETLMRWALLRGNGYAEIERSVDGRPLNLWPLHPSRIDVVRLPNGALAYEVMNYDGARASIPSHDMFHIAGPSEDGIIGLPVITFAALSMGMSAATERYGADFFANSAMPSGVLKHPKALGEEAAARIEKSWKLLQGGRRSQGMVVLEEGMEFQAIAIPNDQAQMLEARKSSVEEICRWFGVPLQKVMATSQATYKNMEQFNKEVVTDTGIPWIKNFEQEADFKLLSDNRAGAFSMMDTRPLLRGDSVERSTWERNLFTVGAISVNEIRDIEGFAPVPGGDRRYLQINQGPVNDDGTIESPAPAAAPVPGDNEPPANDDDAAGGDEPPGAGAGDGRPAAPVDDAARRASDDRILAALIPEVQRIARGERGPRGQRGPRGLAVARVFRGPDGRLRREMTDGAVIEETVEEATDGGS
jgi:HK97 family phage portal protein